MRTQLAVPQADPRANYLAYKAEIDEAIARVLNSGRYILDQEVAAFEEEFAAYIGVRHGIGVASGTDALQIALRTCGIGPGDAVITVSYTAVATVAAIELVGAMPVLIDIEPKTFTMDPNSLEDVIKNRVRGRCQHFSSRLKAIIPVHLYGHPADMPAIIDIAKRYNLCVIEDCAQSHGAAIQGRKTGSWGNIAAFSFYPTKNLSALGDGGMVVTNDLVLAARARSLRQYGWRDRYISEIAGLNSRLHELQAAILRVKLRYLDEDNQRRREWAALYNRLLLRTSLQLPLCKSEVEHCYHLYVVRSSRRDELRAFLHNRRIGTGIHYPLPVHLQPAYSARLCIPKSLLHSEQSANKVLSLPMFPELTSEQIHEVVEAIVAWNQGARG